MRATWTAVTVETPRSTTLSAQARGRVAAALKLALELGATLATIPAATVVEGLRAHVIEAKATAVVIGKSQRSWWFELRHGSVVDQLVRGLDGVAVYVMPTGSSNPIDDESGINRRFSWSGTAVGLLFVALTTAISLGITSFIGANSVDLLYLVPVIATATLFGLRPALVASFTAALAYNFFFLPPIYTFTISDPQNAITFLVLIGVAVVASQLTGRLKREATIGARTAIENAAISGFGQRLAGISDEAGTAQIVCDEVAALLSVSTILATRKGKGLVVIASSPSEAVLGPLETAAAEWALDRTETTGRDTGTLASCDWQFHPLVTSLGVLAVLGVGHANRGNPVPPEKRILFATLLGQAALAHERIKLEAQARDIGALKQRDHLRATLLASIGHDLKTPLTAVVAAADALSAENGENVNSRTLKAEARRLRRVFDDLVEMTRIEADALVVRHDVIDLTDAVVSAAQDLKAELLTHKLVLDVPPTLPLVDADPRMLNHILVNLIGNAAKFAAAGTSIVVEGRRLPDGVTLAVLDSGSGLPPGGEAALFNRFSRVKGDDMSGGTGLGLAIVKGFADAMGLHVSASNRADMDGSRFEILWPAKLIRIASEVQEQE
jgi:two-component system, OmpR family, sensor histidine kinase KdpD